MTRIIGDRRGKSALDEMEEVARARNKDVAEEERLEALRKAEETLKPKAPSELVEVPAVIPAMNVAPTLYNGLEFEPKAYSEAPDNLILTYGRSLGWIRQKGYQRHPTPCEVFSLLADNLEEKLQDEYKAVAKDMLSCPGEWLSMAMERKEDLLICYLHPEGLCWNNDAQIYRKGSFSYTERYEFDVTGKNEKWGISLKEFEDEFVKLFYGRIFNDLPEEMRQGKQIAFVELPKDGELFPAYRMNFAISGHTNGNPDWLSRGVLEKKIMINSNTNGGIGTAFRTSLINSGGLK
ncbi:MAG: hypothetical protein V1734_06985 [Nanoarchaeota archaeon]